MEERLFIGNPAPGFADELRFVRKRPLGKAVTSAPAAIAALQEYIDEEPRESMWLLVLDIGNRVIGAATVAVGGFTNVVIDRKVIAAMILTAKGAAFIVIHNHPSGSPTPSPEDLEMTKALTELARVIEVKMLDSIILGAGGKYWSAADAGMLS